MISGGDGRRSLPIAATRPPISAIEEEEEEKETGEEPRSRAKERFENRTVTTGLLSAALS